MSQLEVVQISALSDNYCVLIHDAENGLTGVIDTPEVHPIETALSDRGWTLTHIINTHHHHDHTGGNRTLKDKYDCQVVGPANSDIPGIDIALKDGDTFSFGPHSANIITTPGHTLDHICYWFKGQNILFAGDTLFALGCGRVFEGTPSQMWNSLQKLRDLPDETTVYCGHEYTLSNAKFAISIDSDNAELKSRVEEIEALRANNQSTVPTNLGLEKRTNPFLRADSLELQKQMGLSGDAAKAFAAIRQAKDNF